MSSSSASGTPRLGVLLAMAMFVFVIDTSLMNVSISAVVRDLDTTASGVQAAVALEALVSAAFILIGSKLGDLFGRKRAYVTGLVFYALGAVAMVFAEGLAAIIVFWAFVGGLGAALYLPAMQSLIHGNFEGELQAKVFAMIGAAGAIAAAVGPLLGGLFTTLLSWRVGFLLEGVIIAGVLLGTGLIRDVPYTGDRSVDVVGSILSVLGMSLLVLGVLAWQEGASRSRPCCSPGRCSRSRWCAGSSAAAARASPRCSTPSCSPNRSSSSESRRASASRWRSAGC
jgi:MFS family permease